MNSKFKTIDLTLSSMFVVLIAIGANITSMIPGMVVGGVPITLQTFFAILAGLILGSRLGVLTTSAYAFIGLVGIPVFAQFSAGLGILFKPTFGFILSYILVALRCRKNGCQEKQCFILYYGSTGWDSHQLCHWYELDVFCL